MGQSSRGRVRARSRWRSRSRAPTRRASGLLEATFDPGCRLGEWDFQMLGIAAQLGALVLEIERSRLQLARAGLLDQQRRRGATARRR